MKSKTFLWLLAGKELNDPVDLPCQGLPLVFFFFLTIPLFTFPDLVAVILTDFKLAASCQLQIIDSEVADRRQSEKRRERENAFFILRERKEFENVCHAVLVFEVNL